MRPTGGRDDRGSTIPLILGFFLLAATMVAAAVVFGQVFVQQRDLQDLCDGAASAAAASAVDLDRGDPVVAGGSLRLDGVEREVGAYLARDPSRRGVHVRVTLSDRARRVTLACRQSRELAFGSLFAHGRVQHTATSSARAAVFR